MVTTRDLEQVVESALLDAGVSEERARAAAARLGDELVQLPTKADLDERFRDSDDRWDERFRLSEQRSKDRFDALDERFRQSDKHIDERFKHLQRLIDQIDRTNWRLTLMVMGLWSATFGALMYAVFGA